MSKKIIVVLKSISVILILLTIIFACLIKKEIFIKPSFEKNVTSILSEVEKNIEYSEVSVDKNYKIGIVGKFYFNNKNNLKVCFTSPSENKVYLKMIIYDNNEKLIAQTGLIKPGERIETIKMNNKYKGKKIIIKIISYDMKTYYSMGTAKFKSKIEEDLVK